jgi:hypothetical protein
MLRWSRHVARIGEKKIAYTVFGENFKERDHLEDVNEDVKINVNIDYQE